eukprot:scaffold105922_cov58-Attheya_sp.AAC.1
MHCRFNLEGWSMSRVAIVIFGSGSTMAKQVVSCHVARDWSARASSTSYARVWQCKLGPGLYAPTTRTTQTNLAYYATSWENLLMVEHKETVDEL